MKKNKLSFLVILFGILIGCSKDNEVILDSVNAVPVLQTCYLTPALVTGENCYSMYGEHQGFNYTLYVTSGGYTTSIDRFIQVMVIFESSIVSYASVKIPAGQHLSNNVPVFINAPRQYDDVTLKIANVNGNSVSDCEWREIETSVINCFIPQAEDCVDEDNNGICDSYEGCLDLDNDGACDPVLEP